MTASQGRSVRHRDCSFWPHTWAASAIWPARLPLSVINQSHELFPERAPPDTAMEKRLQANRNRAIRFTLSSVRRHRSGPVIG
jgi:hypothetical protein